MFAHQKLIDDATSNDKFKLGTNIYNAVIMVILHTPIETLSTYVIPIQKAATQHLRRNSLLTMDDIDVLS